MQGCFVFCWLPGELHCHLSCLVSSPKVNDLSDWITLFMQIICSSEFSPCLGFNDILQQMWNKTHPVTWKWHVFENFNCRWPLATFHIDACPLSGLRHISLSSSTGIVLVKMNRTIFYTHFFSSSVHIGFAPVHRAIAWHSEPYSDKSFTCLLGFYIQYIVILTVSDQNWWITTLLEYCVTNWSLLASGVCGDWHDFPLGLTVAP